VHIIHSINVYIITIEIYRGNISLLRNMVLYLTTN